MDHPLSDAEIRKKLNQKANIVLYKDLERYNNIDDLLYPFDSCVILYEVIPRSGHWVCVIRTVDSGRPCIEFFDSYGNMIDTQQKHIDKDFLVISGQINKMLSRLLLISDPRYLISYNQYPFQKLSKDISTCGRWCVLRILNKSMNLDDFHTAVVDGAKLLKLTKDEFVSALI